MNVWLVEKSSNCVLLMRDWWLVSWAKTKIIVEPMTLITTPITYLLWVKRKSRLKIGYTSMHFCFCFTSNFSLHKNVLFSLHLWLFPNKFLKVELTVYLWDKYTESRFHLGLLMFWYRPDPFELYRAVTSVHFSTSADNNIDRRLQIAS